jgi:O-antigen/teichoic acid export membrane protein
MTDPDKTPETDRVRSGGLKVGASIARSVLSNWVGMAVTGVASFILTPILIHGLGDFQYGMWVLVMSITDSYGLLDTGMRITMQRYVARLKGIEAREALNETFMTALAIMMTISFGVCILSVVLAVLAPSFFHMAGASSLLFRRLIVVVGVTMAIILPTRALGTYLSGLQRFDLYNLGAVVTNVLRAIFLVVIIRVGRGVLGVAIVGLGAALFSLLLHWALVRWIDREMSFSIRKVSWGRVRELAGFSFYVYLSTTGDHLRFYTDSLVIGRVLGVALVTPFSAAGRLLDYFRAAVLGLAGPFMPRMSELEGQTKQDELRATFFGATKAATILSLFIGSIALLDGKWVFQFWLGERFTSAYVLLMVLCAGYVVAMSQWPSIYLILAMGRHRLLGLWTLGEGVANVILSIHWAHEYGLIGVALGTAVPMLVTGLLVQPWYVFRLTGISARDYFQRCILRPVLASAFFLLLLVPFLSRLVPTGLGSFAGLLLAQIVLFVPLMYLIGLRNVDRQAARARCRNLAASVGWTRI